VFTFWIALAFIAGAFMPLQSGVNSTLALQSSGAIWASLISFVVGSIAWPGQAALWGLYLLRLQHS